MPKFSITPASIDAINDELISRHLNKEGENSSFTKKVLKAFINARELISKFNDLDTIKAFKLQEKREALIDLAWDREIQAYPYNVITERHDLHYGRAAFIESFLGGYYKAALDENNHLVSTKRENVIISAQSCAFDTLVDIMGYAYAMAAITAADLVTCGRLIGESFFFKGKERSYLATAIICILVKVGHLSRYYVSWLIWNTNTIHCDVYNNLRSDSQAILDAELAVLDLDCDDVALKRTWDLAVAESVINSGRAVKDKTSINTSDLVSTEYLAYIGGLFRDAFDFEPDFKSIDFEIEWLMDELNA